MPGIILKIVVSGPLRLMRRHSVAWKPYPRRLPTIASLILRWMQAVRITSGTILHLCLRIVCLLLILVSSFLLRSHLGTRPARHVALSRHKHHLPSRLRLPVQTTTIILSISCSIRLILYPRPLIRISSNQQLPGVPRWRRGQVRRGPRRNPDRLYRQKLTTRLLFCYGIMQKRQANGKCCLFSGIWNIKGVGLNHRVGWIFSI